MPQASPVATEGREHDSAFTDADVFECVGPED
jgi:hypothetical protein